MWVHPAELLAQAARLLDVLMDGLRPPPPSKT